MSPSKKVLIAGASGVVGMAAARHFATLPEWTVVGLARRTMAVDGVQMVALDLADREQCAAVLAEHRDTTHIVYAALFEKPGLVPGWFEADQMQRNLDMFANLLDPLAATARLEHISLLQGTKAYGAHVAPMRLPAVERWPRHPHENFYWLQEDYLRAKQTSGAWAHTILRPQVVFGEAFGSNMNALPAFGVYAAILAHDGRPLDYPGQARSISEAVDADLVARALAWAATAPAARNETFNVTNGDVMVIEDLWPAIADAFGMPVGERIPTSLAVEMPKRQDTWSALVAKYRLRSPDSLERFVGQSFIYADLISGFGRDTDHRASLVSTIKIRQAGFHDCVDTEMMFRRLIRSMQDQQYLPPPPGWVS